MIKPKGKVSQNLSITEINALLRSTHKLRRQMLLKRKDIEFSLKVFQYQEIFYEDALIYEYSLIKDKLFSYEKLENEARTLLDGTIHKYSISNEHFLTERDFQAIQKLCNELDESNIVYKNGLTNPHPPIGVLMVPTGNSTVQNVFLFVKNLPYKMNIRVSITGLHKELALLVIVYRLIKRSPSQIDIAAFKDLTKIDALKTLQKSLNKLVLTVPPQLQNVVRIEFDGFEKLFSRYLNESVDQASIDWQDIQPPPPETVIPYAKLTEQEIEDTKSLLDKLIVIKLNGGLGTTMGCQGPKSVISVRSGLTFLDLTIQQLEQLNRQYDCDVPLVLMNSFNTHEETEKVLQKYSHVSVKIYSFHQSKYPRVDRETLLPVATNMSNSESECWYPPGHGDVYQSIYNSGLLDQFIEQGKEYMFLSNIDNLGATVDLHILKHLLTDQTKHEFVMEVTDKTRADVKGGTLIEYQGKLRLLEIAQVPKEHVDEFKSVSKFRIFNTNNLWINLPAVKRIIEDQTLHMEIIVNNKAMDKGINVIQLETASGAAIKSFEGAQGINVPRRRFLPVKTTSDLLLVMSDLFTLNRGNLVMNKQRSFPTVPLVKLGASFTKVKDFLSRFESIPDCLELDSLTVSGDVTFGKGVSLRGTVIIIANHGDRIDIPPGAILENKIVSGNLRILDH
ncbi:unnamed protein product [Rotaria magnacalcarata]|uniref:UTP--glucose-1-phosphate uridylyltransferase n=1 Tax=Rotaria magnacalcarata TaxID=392030 RepID=A0A819APA3_9BILA|nr:unnamed protein product [Rotaria magnacalcarata]CAF3877962.1 unnamed protein product [Rotaria magnacalcarata]